METFLKEMILIRGTSCCPNGLAIPNTPPFIIDAESMAFFSSVGLMACFFCMNGIQQYYSERIRGLCKSRLKISGMFLIKFLVLGLNFAKNTLFRYFSFSFTFVHIIYFGYLNIYIY